MPIPVMNYASLTPQGNPALRDLLPTILQGLQLGYTPSFLQEKLKSQQLENALSEIKNQYAPKMNDAELLYKQAQTPHMNAQTDFLNQQSKYYAPNILSEIDVRNAQLPLIQSKIDSEKFNLQNPLLNNSGPAGQIGAMLYLKNHPELNEGPFGNQTPTPNTTLPQNNKLADMLMEALESENDRKNSFADFNKKRTQAYDYKTLPAAQRNYMLAQAAGMGIDPSRATEKFINGSTLEEMAQERGLDINNLPDPIYPSTQTDITRIHFRQQALAEINTLEPKLTEALAPYANRVSGYSPKQIVESIAGTNKESQSKFLAAQALMPELASLRLKAMGGQVGIEALREVIHASQGNIQSFQSLVSPEIYKGSQKYIEEWLNEAVGKANKVGLGAWNPNKNNLDEKLTINPYQQQALTNSGIGNPGDMVLIQTPNGKYVNFPADKAEELLAKNPTFKRAE
jgi:hypothetical protein